MCRTSTAVLIAIIVILVAIVTMPHWKPQFCGTCADATPITPSSMSPFTPYGFHNRTAHGYHKSTKRMSKRKNAFGVSSPSVAPFGSCNGWSPDATAEKDALQALGA
jgi:hypothetical protein